MGKESQVLILVARTCAPLSVSGGVSGFPRRTDHDIFDPERAPIASLGALSFLQVDQVDLVDELFSDGSCGVRPVGFFQA